ncbi:hypothetical protein [Oryza sativa Japonica Group]|uniref:Uncharacterized protein n=1 Tax=Oryza sativa subsp. japonica TaxID=39947 RepID=Q5N7N8_ORYSJ|nr:hypothetical protein [Oryza sativa Japonica Group]BAD82508.1 hypothetical protein [Oryza sativa Japonica Group]
MEIKRVKIAVHVARIISMILAIGVMCVIYIPTSYVKPLSYRYVLVAMWFEVLMCCTWGMAIAALSTALFARQHRFCISVFKCTRFLVGFVLAVSVGFLSAVKALGMLWILGSQFPRAE